jgi:hypothetical protein
MSSPEDLQRSVDEFYAMLDSMSLTGVSQIAELSQLRVLITKYPQHAREMVGELDRPAHTRPPMS